MKIKKPLQLAVLFGLIAPVLTGCVQRTKSGQPYGLVYDYLAVPGQHVMEWTANLLGHSYGWAIIAVTIVVRVILLPVMMSQMRKSTVQMEKMSAIRPHLTKLQEQQKMAKTPQEQAAVSQQMMQLYRDNGISMTGGIGCLPLLIQMPIFAALYAAIQYSPELSSSVFFGINLGKPAIALAVLAFLSYLLQGYLSMIGMPAEQRKQMRITLVISPAFILFITMSAPAGLGLYFFIGGLFACLQTLLVNMARPRIRKQIEAEMAKNPPKIVDVTTPDPVDSTPATPTQQSPSAPSNRQRNAGKQRHHKN